MDPGHGSHFSRAKALRNDLGPRTDRQIGAASYRTGSREWRLRVVVQCQRMRLSVASHGIEDIPCSANIVVDTMKRDSVLILLIEGRCHNLVECLPEFIERTKVRKSTRQSFGSLDPQVVPDKLFFMRSEYTTVCKTNHGPVPQVPPGPRRYAPLFGSRGALHDAIQDLVQLAKLDPVGLGPWLLGNRLFECLLAEPPPSPLHIQAGGRVCGGSLCRRHAPLCVRFRVLTDGH